MAKVIKRQPKAPHHSLDVFETKAEALSFAKEVEKTKCGVVIWDYGKKGVPVSTGKVIKFAVLAKANQKSCKK